MTTCKDNFELDHLRTMCFFLLCFILHAPAAEYIQVSMQSHIGSQFIQDIKYSMSGNRTPLGIFEEKIKYFMTFYLHS